jgi:hypothetical protein
MKEWSFTREAPRTRAEAPRTRAEAQRTLADAEESYAWYVDNGVMPVQDDVADYSEYDRLENAVETAQKWVAWFEAQEAAAADEHP